MTFATDIADSYVDFDVEDVTVNAGKASEVSGVKGLPRAMNKNDVSGTDIAFSTSSKVWNLWVSTLDGHEMAERDTITGADGKVWLVERIALLGADTRYRCICNRKKA